MSRGPFWRVVWEVNQRPAADLYTNASALARRMAQAIADIHGARMALVDLLPTASPTSRYAPRRNPTLVHHGMAQGALYHLLTQAGAPVADFYLGKAMAERAARAIADDMGIVLELAKNTWSGEHGHDYHGSSRRESPLAGGVTEVGAGLRLPRRNPSPSPLPGQTWRRRGGGSVKVSSVGGGRVAVLDSSGNREWIDLADFKATHTLPQRPNPKRKGRNRRVGPPMPRRQRRAAASGRFAKARHHAQASVARGVRRLDTQRRASFKAGRTANPKGRNPGALYDALGNGIAVGSVLIGTGLQNAGRAYTVLQIRGKRVRLSEHLTSRDFWTFPRHYRVDVNANPRQTLREWSERYGIDMRQKGGAYWIPDSFTNQSTRRELWNLSDYLVSSVAGGTIWLVKRPATNRRKSRRKRRVQTAGVRGKVLRNPKESEVARARRTFRRLNQIEPGTAKRVRGARNAPKVAVQLGELVSVVYRSDKYAGTSDNPHGKELLYEHKTKRPRPVLATDPSGREVHIVGGRMHPTPDGLVN